MSVMVVLTLKAKDDMYETLVGTMKAILPDTAAFEGAELISCAGDAETNTITIWEKWDKLDSQKAYMGWRTDRGDIDKLVAMLSEPPHVATFDYIF